MAVNPGGGGGGSIGGIHPLTSEGSIEMACTKCTPTFQGGGGESMSY